MFLVSPLLTCDCRVDRRYQHSEMHRPFCTLLLAGFASPEPGRLLFPARVASNVLARGLPDKPR